MWYLCDLSDEVAHDIHHVRAVLFNLLLPLT
jgi:hypothetical protein